MTKRYNEIPSLALTAVCAALAIAAAPASAVPITMTYLQQAGFYNPAANDPQVATTWGGTNFGDPPDANQGGLEFFIAVPAGANAPNPPAPPLTWKGLAWGCPSAGQCAPTTAIRQTIWRRGTRGASIRRVTPAGARCSWTACPRAPFPAR